MQLETENLPQTLADTKDCLLGMGSWERGSEPLPSPQVINAAQ